jgi:membrane-associated phospholipid phosphatase
MTDTPHKAPHPNPYPAPPVKHRRLNYPRFALLIALIAGLIIFLISLPAETRTGMILAVRRQRLLIGMVLVFVVVSLSLIWSAGQQLDSRLFLWINLHGARPRWLDIVMNLTTHIGNLVTALALGNLFFFINQRRLAIEILLGTVSLWVVVEALKLLTDRSRPFLAVEGTRVVGWRERGRSFPSGHTSQTFFLMTLLIRSLQLPAIDAFLLYMLAILVGFTRIYMGVHYPRDVLGGALLGTSWGVLASVLEPYLFGQ